jgi:peptidoglycan/xylan/chitin deacetylase (PgdA/CDA1 family)
MKGPGGEMIPVLMYHHVNPHAGDPVTLVPEVFARQMDFLAEEGYTTLSADELIAFIHGTKGYGEKTVAITFDDGWLDNLLFAVPVLSAHKFKATFFVITDRIDAASRRERQFTDDIPGHETAKLLIQSDEAEKVVLSWNMIKELEASGLFRSYSHTLTHRRGAVLSVSGLYTELADSKNRLESVLGRDCDYLCWPYGSFSAEGVSIAKTVGYKALFTTIDGYCEPGSDQYMIQRIEVENSVEWLKNRLSGGVK